jgi:hypothetical protein
MEYTTMKKRYILIAGITSIAAGLAAPANAELMVNNSLQNAVNMLTDAPLHERHYLADFAGLGPVHLSAAASHPSDQDPANRLRLASWLLGPSIIAMVTIARRRDTKNKPG